MSRIFTSKYNPGRARWELVVSPQGDVYAFPLTLPIAQRQARGGHKRYLVGRVARSTGDRSAGPTATGATTTSADAAASAPDSVAWTAAGPSGLIYGTTFPSLPSALEAIADEVDLAPVP